MDSLEHIKNKFNLTINPEGYTEIPIGRFKDLPRLFAELGFKVGAEVGVYRGSYSNWLFRYIPGLKLYAVDAWVSYSDYKDFIKDDIADAYEETKRVLKDKNAIIIKAWSVDAAEQIEDGSLDFVFIDGNHKFEYVVQDIAIWSKKVRKGGIVYGHDFDDYSGTKRWEEMTVIPAVEGWMKAHKIKPWFITTKNRNKCWMYVK